LGQILGSGGEVRCSRRRA